MRNSKLVTDFQRIIDFVGNAGGKTSGYGQFF